MKFQFIYLFHMVIFTWIGNISTSFVMINSFINLLLETVIRRETFLINGRSCAKFLLIFHFNSFCITALITICCHTKWHAVITIYEHICIKWKTHQCWYKCWIFIMLYINYVKLYFRNPFGVGKLLIATLKTIFSVIYFGFKLSYNLFKTNVRNIPKPQSIHNAFILFNWVFDCFSICWHWIFQFYCNTKCNNKYWLFFI